MTRDITVTKQWQIYIPQDVRTELKLDIPYKMEMTVKNGKIILEPKKSKIMELAGFVKVPKGKKIDIDTIRDSIDYSDL